MTLDQIVAALDAAERKATKGPWEAMAGGTPLDPDPLRWAVVTNLDGPIHYCVASIENGRPGDCLETEAANADFIALARNHIRTLIEAVKVYQRYCDGRMDATDVADCQEEISRIEAKHGTG